MTLRLTARVDANQPEIVRACKTCNVEMPLRPPRSTDAHKENKKKYCSMDCAKKSLKGTTNPNYSNAGRKICAACSNVYLSYNNTRKYCSQSCYFSTKPKAKPYVKKVRQPKKVVEHKPRVISENVYRKCLMCENTFRIVLSTTKKYCSYQCYLNSGGAQRAGKAAKSMTRKYGAKKDANHGLIVGAFEKLGAHVIDMSIMGNGVPDILVMCRDTLYLVDIKNPNTGYGRRGLNSNQKEWAAAWQGGPVYLISTVEQAAEMVNGKLDSLKRFPECE